MSEDQFSAEIVTLEPKLRGLARRVLGDDEDARDAVQDALIRAYTALPRFRAGCKLSSWLYRITMNVCRDRLRTAKRRVECVSLEAVGFDAFAAPPDFAAAENYADRCELTRLVGGLSAVDRRAVVLRGFDELTFAQIAQVDGIPLSTAKTRYFRAVASMRARAS